MNLRRKNTNKRTRVFFVLFRDRPVSFLVQELDSIQHYNNPDHGISYW